MTELDDSALAALDRLLALAARDTGQSRRATGFLLAWRSAESCGGCGPTDLWAVDGPIAADTLPVVPLIARRHDDSTDCGRGTAFERFVDLWDLWQPALVEADR